MNAIIFGLCWGIFALTSTSPEEDNVECTSYLFDQASYVLIDLIYSTHQCYPDARFSPMLTRVKRENEKRSKTANLFTNLIKVGKRRRLDLGYICF